MAGRGSQEAMRGQRRAPGTSSQSSGSPVYDAAPGYGAVPGEPRYAWERLANRRSPWMVPRYSPSGVTASSSLHGNQPIQSPSGLKRSRERGPERNAIHTP